MIVDKLSGAFSTRRGFATTGRLMITVMRALRKQAAQRIGTGTCAGSRAGSVTGSSSVPAPVLS